MYLTGRGGLAAPFCTSRGIKQGCPASPMLFTLLLSGLERRVSSLAADAAFSLPPPSGAAGPDGSLIRGVISYADDIKLLARSAAGLRTVFGVVVASLRPLGLGFAMRIRVDLDCSGSHVGVTLLVVLDKCSALVLGGSRVATRVQDTVPPDYLDVGPGLVAVVPRLRFLGVGISATGAVSPWRPPGAATGSVRSVLSRLSRVGMSTYPAAVVCALGVAVLPALLYGAELWAVRDLLGVVRRGASPYHASCFTPVLETLKRLAGLPTTAFSAPVYRLF